MKVIACIPVFGRLPLVKHTIERLLNKNKVYAVIAIVSSSQDHDYMRVMNLPRVHTFAHPNNPLGAKWNLAFQHAKQFNPDACLFVGSSDWLSDNWIPSIGTVMEMDDVDMIGKPDCYFIDLQTKTGLARAAHWPGYNNERYGEAIGIGRMLSRRILDKIDWQPFNPTLDKNMDYSMLQKVNAAGAKVMLYEDDGECKALSVSTDLWGNKHQFNDHWNMKVPSTRIEFADMVKQFPEALSIFPKIEFGTIV